MPDVHSSESSYLLPFLSRPDDSIPSLSPGSVPISAVMAPNRPLRMRKCVPLAALSNILASLHAAPYFKHQPCRIARRQVILLLQRGGVGNGLS